VVQGDAKLHDLEPTRRNGDEPSSVFYIILSVVTEDCDRRNVIYFLVWRVLARY